MKEDEIYKVVRNKIKIHLAIMSFFFIGLFFSLIYLIYINEIFKLLLTSIFFLGVILICVYKSKEKSILENGKLVSFEVLDSRKSLFSRGVFYVPIVKCLDDGSTFELKQLKNIAPFPKGSLIRGYYYKKKVLLIDKFLYG